LPDKAIDALDEVGSRVHLTNIVVPQEILDIEEDIEKIKEEKNNVIKSQQYEKAAELRDTERQLLERLDAAKTKWEEDTKKERITVTEDHVAEVVSMMTGIPLQRVAQSESGKLVHMSENLHKKVIGQDEAVKKWCVPFREIALD
jgi:ATP-dependent Clp protease ATP-binding subunit ClpC